MPAAAFVVPGRLDTRTGGYIYDRRMAEGVRRHGWDVDVLELSGTFPSPSPDDLRRAAAAIAAVPAATMLVVDSLALGAIPDIVVREASRRRVVALVHLPLAADPGLDGAAVSRFERAERRALAAAALVIVTGTAGRDLLARHYDLAPDRVVVVEPGTDPAAVATGSRTEETNLLCVATLGPGKGHEMLLEAVAAVPAHGWRLACAGSLTRHRATAERVRAAVRRLGLQERVSLLGDLESAALASAYDAADVFVLASCRETYGMAVAEALARGLPVVATATGAVPQLVGASAGIVVPIGDTVAMTAALSRVISDPRCRSRLAAGARRVRERLSTWEEAASRMVEALAPHE